MNKTLTIAIHQDPTQHVEDFFNGWHQFGSIEQISDLEYRLIGPCEKSSVLTLGQHEITITGEIPSVSFMLIDQLSRACEADKVIEGEFIDKNQTAQNNTNNPFANSSFGQAGGAEFKMPLGMSSVIKISSLSKAKLILLLILALPLIIIMLPVIFVVAIYKIIRFKLNF